ncbi:MAG TPA: alpha/beta fold hydrolase [Legionella sp.]|nr:alpha/beta fold hydrolase [Legionella sp.]
MNVNIYNEGRGTPLVFFHGWGFDGSIWHSLLPYLIKSYHVYLVDLPGFGLTPMMNWDEFKSDLLKKLPTNFALAGWSLGGLYATRLAIEEPARVLKLLNIASSPRFPTDDLWPGIAPNVFTQFFSNLSRDSKQTLQNFLLLQLQENNVSFSLGIPPSESGLASGLNILHRWDLREKLKSINIPVYYMFGRLDSITPVKTMNVMQSHYPDFKYKIFNKSAHMPFLSETDLFITELTGFIQ